MKKNLLMAGLLIASGFFFTSKAQIDPKTNHLKHLWAFDDTLDAAPINKVNGTLKNGATITDGHLLTASGAANYGGDYISFDGEALALNTYPEITFQTWVQADTAPWNAMLFYFGDITGDVGSKGVFATSISRAAISTYNASSPWSGESSAAGTGYNADGLDHQVVVILMDTAIIYYLDGVFQASASMTKSETEVNSIAGLGTSTAWIGRGGYKADPAWCGKVYQFSIYDKALSEGEIQFLFDKGKDVVPVFPVAGIASVDKSAPDFVYVENNKIAVKLNLEKASTVEFSVYNTLGMLITKQKANYSEGINYKVLDADLSSGMYMVNITRNNKSFTYKVIK
jgi:hypothetical protein